MMDPDRPWLAEISVSPELARALIEEQFSSLSAETVEAMGEGWDNVAYRVNGQLVFRFPRRQVAAGLLETESRFLPGIAPLLPLQVPRPEWLGRPSARYPWSFSGYRLLPGVTACSSQISIRDRHRTAEPLAGFLAALHGIDADDPKYRHLPGDRIGRLDIEKLRGRMIERMTHVQEWCRAPDLGALRSFALDHVDRPSEPFRTPVHGDLYARHILVDSDGSPIGVIDWGDVHIGDPAVDLSAAHSFLPPEAQGAFLDRYGAVEESRWERARFRALHHTLMVACYSHDIEDRVLEAESLRSLDRLDRGLKGHGRPVAPPQR